MRVNPAVKGMTTKQGIATLRSVCVQSGASGAHVLIPATAENAIDHVNVRTKMMKAMTKKIAIRKTAQVDTFSKNFGLGSGCFS